MLHHEGWRSGLWQRIGLLVLFALMFLAGYMSQDHALMVHAQTWGPRLQQQADLSLPGNSPQSISAVCDRGNGVMVYTVTNAANALAVVAVPGGCQKVRAEKE